ncbi:MAG: hypothetical protein QF718_04610 [Phycisphaerales bacterium]|jgi:hypothetical protein|nr:hypothetical protein [Phycisphaerales bacterium]
MSRKLIFTVLCITFAALVLLSIRQAQINTVNEMTQLHREIDTCNSAIDALSIKIEIACSPNIKKSVLTTVEKTNGTK